MTDKELLEAAARAAGYPIPNPVGRYPTSGFKEDGTFYWRSGDDYREERTWNPLTDDGDAFRLMVDLELAVISSKPQTWCESKRGIEAVNHCNDKMSATRRAIVLAAAGLVKK